VEKDIEKAKIPVRVSYSGKFNTSSYGSDLVISALHTYIPSYPLNAEQFKILHDHCFSLASDKLGTVIDGFLILSVMPIATSEK